jgi:hypothetical protein
MHRAAKSLQNRQHDMTSQHGVIIGAAATAAALESAWLIPKA